jgi:hypothetical protein
MGWLGPLNKSSLIGSPLLKMSRTMCSRPPPITSWAMP